ncbi:MAG: cysteine desulfurase [Pseudohongiellaceae bacterium]|jgi:cysteine desulfurase
MNKPIYLDYAATTPVDPRVADKLVQHLMMDGVFANPASRSHMYGWQAEAAVENARKQVAKVFNADTREIVWTSGATESNNLAIKGVAEARQDWGKHLITSQSEHKAVIDCFKYLETKGFRVTWLKPDSNGVVAAEDVLSAICDDTILISLMHVNNETGVITDVYKIANIAKARDIVFHIDAAQSAGKLVLDTQVLAADLISTCAHKIYGPKGVGCLYVRRNADFILPAQIHGGGHERGMRSGTLPTHQLVAMGEAFAIAQDNMENEQADILRLKHLFLDGLGKVDFKINGDINKTVSGILNLSFPGKDGQILLSALPGLAISSGSACTSASMLPSHVLASMGLSDDEALASLRFSFGRFTSEEDVCSAAKMLSTVLSKMA